MKIKIISDTNCILYIDNERIAQIPANKMTIIPIEKGEYIVKYECVGHKKVFIEKDLFVEYDRVERISFLDHILSHKDLLDDFEKKVVRGDNGLFGYELHGTSLVVIPCIYDEANDYHLVNGRELAYVKKDGYATFLNGQGEPMMPFGEYKTIDYYKGLFIAKTMKGERFVISDEGVKMMDVSDYESSNPLENCLPFYNLIAIRTSNNPDDPFKAFFPSGEFIDSFGEFEEIHTLFIPDGYYRGPLSQYYIITKNGRSGVVRVDRKIKQVVWIISCNCIVKSYYARISDDQYDPICGVPREEFDTFGCAGLLNPERNIYFSISNYPEHDVLVVSESTDDENGPEVPCKITMYDAHGQIVLQRENVEIGTFSYGEAVITYRNGEQHLIDSSGRIFDRNTE